jgi:hypothetical protein
MDGEQNFLESSNIAPPQTVVRPVNQVITTARLFWRLVECRPLIFWGGLWASLVLIAVTSVSTLISPSWVDGEAKPKVASQPASPSISAQVLAKKPTQAIQPLPLVSLEDKRQSLPIWWFGAIPVSCIVGSVVVLRLLNASHLTHRRKQTSWQSHSTSPRSALKPVVASRLVVQHPGQRRSSQSSVLPVLPAVDLPMVVNGYGASGVNSPGRSHSRAGDGERAMTSLSDREVPPSKASKISHRSGAKRKREKRQPPRPVAVRPVESPVERVQVTVVPREEVHPLDWQATNLLDAVDLRRRRSLASWL